MFLFSSLCVITLVYLLYRIFYKPFSEKEKIKKERIKRDEDHFKRHLIKYHPEFTKMFMDFKEDQDVKRKRDYHCDQMKSEGGYVTQFYGKYVFVYDEYFEKCFNNEFDLKYNELINNPLELKKIKEIITNPPVQKKVKEMIPNSGN
jgi:hypothetical protein